MGGVEQIGLDDGLEGAFLLDPHIRGVHHPGLLELEGDAVVDVVADVLLVGQYLIDGGARPLPVQVGAHLHAIQAPGNLRFRQSLLNEPLVDQIDDTSLVVGAGHQDYSIGLKAFVLATSQFALHGSVLVDQDAAESITGRAALAVAEFDQATLAGEHLGRQFPAVLAGHGPLDALDDGGDGRAIVLELLGAIGDLDAGAAADVLVVSTLIGILKTPPATDVVDQDDLEIGLARLDIVDQPLEGLPAIDAQTALALVGIGLDDLDATPGGVFLDLVGLVLRGVLLVLGRHPHILRCPE